MKKSLIAIALLLSLAACSEDQPLPKYEQTGGAHINLNVTNITMVDHSSPPTTNSPYNTNNFQPTLAQAMRQWATDHIQAVGLTGGEAAFIIKDASLTIETVAAPTNQSTMDKWFTRNQTTKYVAHVEAELEAKNGQTFAAASADATHYQTLPENPSEEERQIAYVHILNGVMKDLAQNLQSSIDNHMQNFALTSAR